MASNNEILIHNLVEAIKFLAPNPNLTSYEIIEMFSNPNYKEYFDKLNKED